jgi:hypothetical protein
VFALIIFFLAGSYFVADYTVMNALGKLRVVEESSDLSLIDQTRIAGIVFST